MRNSRPIRGNHLTSGWTGTIHESQISHMTDGKTVFKTCRQMNNIQKLESRISPKQSTTVKGLKECRQKLGASEPTDTEALYMCLRNGLWTFVPNSRHWKLLQGQKLELKFLGSLTTELSNIYYRKREFLKAGTSGLWPFNRIKGKWDLN